MQISVIIVNYNVKHFLEQCLLSVRKAMQHVDGEVWVVDNNSVDQSVDMVKEKFPEVRLIANKENTGFSTANNQAIRQSTTKYVLLLNPDTLVEEFTFKKVVDFMDAHPDAGGLGVKMVDGKGHFLPESKRGLPTPAVAFYKIFGLAALFPKSKTFGRYHLSYLDKDKVHKVEILSGAFMMMRKEALDKVGLLDETFFMYGEDIDLSYRLVKGGYNNYYYPHTRIIHYKGESTKKSSTNYVFVFYRAMVIFARKHFSLRYAKLFSLLINFAIYFRASLSILKRWTARIILPLLDAGLLYGGFYFIKSFWEQKWLIPTGGSYPLAYMLYVVPAYILILMGGILFGGGYDKPYQIQKLIKGLFLGIVSILVMYALLPEDYRYSRAIIIAGTFWGILSLSGIRWIAQSMGWKHFGKNRYKNRTLVVGSLEEATRVSRILRDNKDSNSWIAVCTIEPQTNSSQGVVGHLEQLPDLIRIYEIEEVVFCAKDMAAQTIIDKMIALDKLKVDYKIAPEESMAIIGSQSINTGGDLFTIQVDGISNSENKRNKRALDIVLALALLFTYPVNMWWVKQKGRYLSNLFSVLIGKKTWVGFYTLVSSHNHKLPQLKQGVLHPGNAYNDTLNADTLGRLNLLYARDYSIMTDLNIIKKGFAYLGDK